jgi:hypothetical protein
MSLEGVASDLNFSEFSWPQLSFLYTGQCDDNEEEE